MKMIGLTKRSLMMGQLVMLCLFYVFSFQVQAAEKILYTGFLDRYPAFKLDPDFKDVYMWRNPKANLKKYSKIMVAPLEIWLSPDSEYKGLTADQIGLVNRMYQFTMIETMEPDYPIVSKPGNDVLVLRVALTNVNIKTKDKRFYNFLPPMLLMRGVDAAVNKSLKSFELNLAQMEGELRDSMTNELISARVATGFGLEGKEPSFEGIMDFWKYRMNQFKEAMDASRK